jgi:23S rRNA-/tRNA-specific pseudouridylate synthase
VRVRQFLETKAERPYVGCLHRLDRPVSGVLVFGLNKRATKKIATQFETREVKKTYWAIVAGRAGEPAGRWIDMMRKVPDEPRSEIASADHNDAKQAILNYRTIGEHGGWSWLKIDLETGRTHQIRLQCMTNLAPILGDELYGSTVEFGPQSEDVRQRWIALHARDFEFFDPATQSRIQVQAPVPSAWQELANGFPDIAEC